MTNVSRPIHLQLRSEPSGNALSATRCNSDNIGTPRGSHAPNWADLTEPFSPTTSTRSEPTSDSKPSQILPHLFVGAQEQTNCEAINNLNIKYILSLGPLPLVIEEDSNYSETKLISKSDLTPELNSSKDFKIRIKTTTKNTPSSSSSSGLPISDGSCSKAIASTSAAYIAATDPDADVIINETAEAPIPRAAPSDTDEAIDTTIAAKTESQTSSELATTSERTTNRGKLDRSVRCKCINVADSSDQMLMKFFDEAYSFIEEARRKKCNILIHCLAGISRSPTVAIAYLMRIKSMHWRDAYELVKQCRPQIDPNLNFIGQLKIYYHRMLCNNKQSSNS